MNPNHSAMCQQSDDDSNQGCPTSKQCPPTSSLASSEKRSQMKYRAKIQRLLHQLQLLVTTKEHRADPDKYLRNGKMLRATILASAASIVRKIVLDDQVRSLWPNPCDILLPASWFLLTMLLFAGNGHCCQNPIQVSSFVFKLHLQAG